MKAKTMPTSCPLYQSKRHEADHSKRKKTVERTSGGLMQGNLLVPDIQIKVNALYQSSIDRHEPADGNHRCDMKSSRDQKTDNEGRNEENFPRDLPCK